MAQQVRVEYYDDIDGEPITDGLAQSFRITVDDIEYEIDLRPSNADKFWAVLQPWLNESKRNRTPKLPSIPPTAHAATATPTPIRTRKPRNRKVIPGRSPEQLAAVRHWARGQGFDVSSRGRIPSHILESFEAAHA
ncbi:MAG TPA: Lsr2 family protein [Rhodococcus sp. (in: high G+C Gram-positive bacteria)]|nr:Lsr2 family protein [Rhodococcus sp. (in: high G+C Gram-positive bacteria)]